MCELELFLLIKWCGILLKDIGFKFLKLLILSDMRKEII